MCYPKPGPRCSAHARTTLVKARSRVRTLRSLGERGDTLMQAREEERVAEEEWYTTPDGQKELQKNIDLGDEVEYNSMRKEYFAQKRKDALKALGIKNATDKHDATVRLYTSSADTFTSSEFLSDDEPRRGWQGEERLQLEEDYIEDSSQWVATLTEKEKVSVRWYTSDGMLASYKIQNGTDRDEIEKETYSSRVVTDEDREKQKYLNNAFKRYRSSKSHVVYRGLNDWAFPQAIQDAPYGKDKEMATEYVKQKYQVGSTVHISEYMSASADPATAVNFAGNDVIFEIKTNRVAPVGVMSAWDSFEREMLVEGDHDYKVVGVKEKVPYQWRSRTGKQEEQSMTVVQLERIPKVKKK